MKKKLQKALAMFMAFNMCMSMLSVTAFAEETVVENADGSVTTTVTTEGTPETDENGNMTVVVTIEESTTKDGETLSSSKETTTTTTNAGGDVIATEKQQTTTDNTTGTTQTTTTNTTYIPEGKIEEDQAEVSVELKPGETTSGSATDTKVNVTYGESAGKEYEYTITTETEREVTVDTESITQTEGATHGDLVSTNPTVSFEEYTDGTGKQEVTGEVYPGAQDPRKDLFQGGGSYENNWNFAKENGYIKEEVDEEGNGTGKFILDVDALENMDRPLIDGKTPEYLLIAAGEKSDSKLGIKEVQYEYVTDENGNQVIKLDEEGNPVYNLGSYEHKQHVAPMILWGTDGKAYYAYSVASDKEAFVSSMTSAYEAQELSKAEQFKDDKDTQEHIRGIALHGYWGATNEQDAEGNYKDGGLEKIKAEMTEAVENGLALELNGSTNKDEILAAIAGLTEGDALTATQAAFWAYSYGTESTVDGTQNSIVTGNFTNDANGCVSLVYQYLLGVTEKDPEMISVDKDSMNLVVGDKIGEKTVEDGENTTTSGIYDAALNFSLTIVPGAKDELNVVLNYTDADGNNQTVFKALGKENNDNTIAPDADGSYTLTGLKLSEKQELTFELKLEGTQYLENGVYIYSSTNSNEGLGAEDYGPEGAPYSTLVGVGEAGRKVDVTTSVTLSFEVDDTNSITVERRELKSSVFIKGETPKDKTAEWEIDGEIAEVVLTVPGSQKELGVDIVYIVGSYASNSDGTPNAEGDILISSLMATISDIVAGGVPVNFGMVPFASDTLPAMPLTAIDKNNLEDLPEMIEAALANCESNYDGMNMENALVKAKKMFDGSSLKNHPERQHLVMITSGLTYGYNSGKDNAEFVCTVPVNFVSTADKNGNRTVSNQLFYTNKAWQRARTAQTNTYPIPKVFTEFKDYSDWEIYWSYIDQWARADIAAGDTIAFKATTIKAGDFRAWFNSGKSYAKNTTFGSNSHGAYISDLTDATGKTVDPADFVTMYPEQNPLAEGSSSAHAIGYERAMWEAYEYCKANITGTGINFYPIYNELARQHSNGNTEWCSWTDQYIGHNFVNMLAGGEDMAVKYDKSGNKAFFKPIKEQILYTCSVGSVVEDYIGYDAEEGNFEFINDKDSITVTVNGVKYVTSPTATVAGATSSYAFAKPAKSPEDKQPEPTFWLDYYRGNGKDTEHFVWTFGENVSLANRAVLTYQLKLDEKSEEPGTHRVDTNLYAILVPKNSDGEYGDAEYFRIPNLPYTVEEPTIPDGDDDGDDDYYYDDDDDGDDDDDDGDDLEEILDEETPLASGDGDGDGDDFEEILEEEIPLADIPMTGDNSFIWLALSILSGICLVATSTLDRKKREEMA